MDTPNWLSLDGAVNARVVVPGALLRSDNLQGLSGRDVELLTGPERLKVVVDLRTAVEVELEGPGPLIGRAGVRVEHRSLYPESGGRTDLDAETIKPWGSLEEDPRLADETPVVRAYTAYLRHRPDSIVGAIQTIAHSDGAVLVHCAAGKDRTGVVVALALDACGVDRAEIAADYMATAERIGPILERLVSSDTYRAELEGHDPQRHAPAEGTIERVLEIVDDSFGGTVEWLRSHGLTDADLAALRRRLTPVPAEPASD